MLQRFYTQLPGLKSHRSLLAASQSCVLQAQFGTTFTGIGETGSAQDDRPITPWVRSVISGADLTRNPKYNKGLAFTETERDRLYLRGLLPPAILSQDVQADRALKNLRNMANDLDRHSYLTALQERNESLFYKLLVDNIKELLPIVHMPTVSEYCAKYALMFRSLPRALFISLKDKGAIYQILKNWPERRIKAICITDGERVGQLGDLGVQAVGVPVSKLALYTACGGIPPSVCLPVVLDCGTDNQELLDSPFYVGLKQKRVRGVEYQELLDEFFAAAQRRFGNTVLMHLEDMQYENMSKTMAQYSGSIPIFSDDIQGLAAVVIAGILAAAPLTTKKLADHTFLIAGEGRAATSIASIIAAAIARERRHANETILDARKRVWLLDSKGLVVRSRGDADDLDDHKLPYCHRQPTTDKQDCPDLLSAVKVTKPSVLIGISSMPPTITFSEQVCREMGDNNERPIIMPLSQPGAEVKPKDAYTWTDGRCIFADRDTRTDSSDVVLDDGRRFTPSTCETTYLFPGVGLGTLLSRSTKLRDEMFIVAAEALAKLVSDEDRARGAIYPPIGPIRNISAHIAKAVAQRAYDSALATEQPKPSDLYEAALQIMYEAEYRNYR